MRFQIIRNARIENVGKSQSCMVSKVRITWKQTVVRGEDGSGEPVPPTTRVGPAPGGFDGSTGYMLKQEYLNLAT